MSNWREFISLFGGIRATKPLLFLIAPPLPNGFAAGAGQFHELEKFAFKSSYAEMGAVGTLPRPRPN
jgi:hypothetical protein